MLTSSSATRVICKDGAFLDLRDQFGPDATTAYAFCLIESPTAQRAQLCYGANDYARLWLNHKQVHESTTSEQGDSDRGRHTVDVELNAGLNPLLVRIDDAGGKQWGLILEVFGQDGKPLKTTLE